MCDNCPEEYRHHAHDFIVLPQTGASPESAPEKLAPVQPPTPAKPAARSCGIVKDRPGI